MLGYILTAIGLVIVVLIIVIAMRPSDFRISRSAAIGTSKSSIFPLLNNFHRWEEWSPWAKLDPNAVMTYEGPDTGVGSVYRWSGNKKVGAGSGTMIESKPNERVRIRLDFLRPFKATNVAEFTLAPLGNQTTIKWSMTGKANFGAKAFGLFVDCDKMVGKDFEKGLAQLKSIAEREPAVAGV